MLATKKEFYFKSTSSAPATSNLKENEYLFYEVPKELALEFEADQGDLVLKGWFALLAFSIPPNFVAMKPLSSIFKTK